MLVHWKFLFFIVLFGISHSQQECIPDDERIDCHPDLNPSEERCIQRGCTWCKPLGAGNRNTPDCFFPRNYGYKMLGDPVNTGHGYRVQLERSTTDTLFGNEWSNVAFEIDFQSDYRLRIKISDDKARWEVPLKINPPSANLSNNPLYDVQFKREPVFSFKIIRRATGTPLMDTSLGGLTLSDQFIQIGYTLPTKNVYGIGENEQHSLRHEFENRPLFGLWSSGAFPDFRKNMYGVHPQYTVVEDDGNAHAVVIVNSNAQEFEMHPNPGIVYRTIGGILDIYVFLGPTPEQTAQQYTEAVGRSPLPPYWALGFHLCRHGYDTLENLKTVVDRMISSGIPYEVQYGDIDIMDRNLDFTVSPDRFAGLREYVQELKEKGIRFMTILDPCISAVEPAGYRPFELGQEMDVWVKRLDGVTPAQGKVWPDGACYYPDFAKNSTKQWWSTLIKEFKDNMLDFDALWIDMNEPANFVDGDLVEGCAQNSSINFPPYYPRSLRDHDLSVNTLCPDHIDSVSTHYNTHSLYGWYESEATILAARGAVGKRTFALSRSSFLGMGKWATHWALGDNYARWTDMYYSIISVMQFNLFGMPFVGPDICGHQLQAQTELCMRWQQLGAFYPFSRNHNAYGLMDQDPAAFGGQIKDSSSKALRVRYTLLPYLYTLLARHEKLGTTVIRPMFNLFPSDQEALGIDRQFFWGSGILITPVLEERQSVVYAYFPDSRFYDYYTGEEVGIRKNYTFLLAPTQYINVHVHGGNIIPTQDPAVNTMISRNNPFGLIVALNDLSQASGSFFYDDGESFDTVSKGNYFLAIITALNKTINYFVEKNEYPEMATKILDTIRIMGVTPAPTQIFLNGQPHTSFEVLPSGEVFVKSLNLVANQNFVLQYN